MTALPKQGNNILINNKEENTMSKNINRFRIKKHTEKLATKLKRIISNLSSILY